MVTLKSKKNCCGCGACETVCRSGAITLKEDAEGFWYPAIDTDKCTECGLCDKICLFGKKETSAPALKCYIAQHKDDSVCDGSTSGGMYTAFSDVILDQGGVIYSPDFAEDMSVVHKRISTKAERDFSRGSKYVQSIPNGFHKNLICDLKEGLTVGLFGTPCQISGVLACVPEKYKANLYCIDVICNGVGSPMAWQKYVEALRKKYHKKPKKYFFRPKSKGYLTTSELVVFEDGSEREISFGPDKYNSYYHAGLISRPSCTNCIYASFDRISDITIGDYSKENIDRVTFDRSRGLSTLLVNDAKGEHLLALCEKNLILFPSDFNAVSQIRLRHCAKENPNRSSFLKIIKEKGFIAARNKTNGLIKRLKIRVAIFIRKLKDK